MAHDKLTIDKMGKNILFIHSDRVLDYLRKSHNNLIIESCDSPISKMKKNQTIVFFCLKAPRWRNAYRVTK